MTPNRTFQVTNVTLNDVAVHDQTISIEYLADGVAQAVHFEYGPADVGDLFTKNDSAVYTYAVSLAVVGIGRFGAVIPESVDLREFSPWIHPKILEFLAYVLPRHWSEHRYQLDRLDYTSPKIAVDDSALGSKVDLPIFEIHDDSRAVLAASGSGKDSLLCEALLKRGGVAFEPFTYLHDSYGDVEHQREVFSRIRDKDDVGNGATLIIRDDYDRWLKDRMKTFGVSDAVTVDGQTKPFRTEAGEVFVGSFAMIPVQTARGAGVQAFGNERSADFPNLVEPVGTEEISHQFAKSHTGERAVNNLYETLFRNIRRASLTKPIHDVTIFETLFSLVPDLPYLTNSCNHEKPWCRRCEKCLYVFAGFSAFGDHGHTVEAFGRDLFDDPEVLPVWEDLLGLHGRIAWECVGHPEEAQLYFYRAKTAGLSGAAIALFDERIWTPLVTRLGSSGAQQHFDDIYARYTTVDDSHHHMPPWLATAVLDVVRGAMTHS